MALDDVALIRGGIQKQPKRAPNLNPAPFLRVANVTSRGLDLAEVHEVELFDGDAERYRLHYGDLLVVEGNGSASQIGRAGMWRGEIPRAVHQNHLLRVRPAGDLDPRYLELWWNSPASREYLTEVASSSSGLHTLSVRKLKAVRLPLPPLDEQRRIVEILEGHLSRLDAAARNQEKAVKRLSAWWSSSTERLLRSSGESTVRIGDVLREPMRNGRSDRAVESGQDGTRCVTLTAVTRRDFSERYTKVTTTSDAVAAGLWLRDGDVLVQRSNTPELVGSAARYVGPSDWAIFPDLLIRLRPDETRLRSDFLELALQLPRIHRTLRARAKGLAGSMPKIDQGAIAETSVPLPSLETQVALVRYRDELAVQRTSLEGAIARSEERSSGLRRALLAAAFSGQLTGRDSDLERAEELVEA